jgi:chromodomain-helicase-DNA-binding protein 1
MYVGGKRDLLTKKERNRRKQVAAGLVPPSHAETRFSSRAATKRVTNYNEEEEEDEWEEYDDAAANYWAATPAGPQIDIVLNHKLKEEFDPVAGMPTKFDYLYYIKWQGLAHYKATWEDLEEEDTLRKSKKIDNYFKKKALEEWEYQHNDEIPPEDRELFLIQRDEDIAKLDDYVKVERVLGRRKAEDGVTNEYLVKCEWHLRLSLEQGIWRRSGN